MIESHFINASVAATENSSNNTSSTNVDSVDSGISNSNIFSPQLLCSLQITSTTSMSPSGGGGGGGGTASRKTSMSENQQMHYILQNLNNNVHVPDHQCQICFQAKRHQEVIEGMQYERQGWRIRERMKTASVALVLCLNIGVDPPDVVKIQPCARLECWIDPSSVSAPKAMELIGTNLQMQYERWQPRARYKKCHDPTVEDVKKLCTSLRRNAKGERILFHYNGHGVPKPTTNGEIWVFNKTFTQYIPLSIFELQNWMAAPSIYVYDCSNAGIIINSFQQFAEQYDRDIEKALSLANQRGSGSMPQQQPAMVSYKNCIHLAACSANQILPMNAQLPADLFTSCLTTPIIIALKWYTMQVSLDLVPRIQSDHIDKIPGKVNDRRTMLGELNWIFTAITDTIAWNTLPRELFQRLFRQDLLVASLFRNFLLAERILRSHDCIPVSHPAMPPCFRHPMWSAWDLVVDLALQQLPEILEKGTPYRQLSFFEEQLTAFQVWLDHESESRSPPEQLPIVLQVLLSQVHRLRALELLARFLDLGPWAVNLALGVGIFPYVLKLLQSSAKELRPVLVFIWAKILAVDASCQVDLVKDHKYFLAVLQDNTISKEHRTLSAFVLASIVNNFLLGQTSALQGSLVSICLEQLNDESWLLRQWLAICLGMLWQNFEKARWSGVRDLAHEKLYALLKDGIPEVRAAAVFALGTFISSVTDRSEEHANNIDRVVAITLLENVGEDMSPLVRQELVVALQWMVVLFESQFVTVYMQEHMTSMATTVSGERSASITHGMMPLTSSTGGTLHHSTHSLERHISMRRGVSSSSISNLATSSAIPFQSIFVKLWQGIYNLGHDPFPKVAETTQRIIAYIHEAALTLITAKEETSIEKCISLSVSLPPSPNTRVNYLSSASGVGESSSPPIGGVSGQHGHGQSGNNSNSWAAKLRGNATLTGSVLSNEPQVLLQRKLRTTSMNDETDSAPPAASLGATVGDGSPSVRSSTSDNNYDAKYSHSRRPIVTSQFIPWAISYFTRPGQQRYSSLADHQQAFTVDKNTPELRGREYRYQRNRQIRREAKEQQMRTVRIDTQIWLRKTQHTPALVRLAPYESQIAVAYKEKVALFDWSRNTVRSFTPASIGGDSWSAASFSPSLSHALQQRASSRVSAIEFLNAHDVSLVLVGHDDGVVRVWQSGSDENPESRLITAWEGLPSVHGSYTSSFGNVSTASAATVTLKHRKDTSNSSSSSSGGGGGSGSSGSGQRSRDTTIMGSGGGIVTAWQQCTQQLIVGGSAHRYLRVWDVEREMKVNDIAIGSDTSIRVLSPFPCNLRNELIVAGCADGSLRLFDKRCGSQESRIRVYREHGAHILTACLKDNQTTLFYKLCKRWKIEIDKNPQTFDHVRKFLQGPEMHTAIEYMKQRMQIAELTPHEAQLIYTICAFETAWNRRRVQPSIWCSFLNRHTIKTLEFAEDLEYYWNDGYGYELTHKIACPAINDMFAHIDPTSKRPNATVYFTHSGTLLKIIAHLGLYRDAAPLTHNDYQRARSWRTSAIDAFATNVAFIQYECAAGEPFVLTLHQERPVRLPGCPLDSLLCSLSNLRRIYNSSLVDCDFHEICHK